MIVAQVIAQARSRGADVVRRERHPPLAMALARKPIENAPAAISFCYRRLRRLIGCRMFASGGDRADRCE
jgi:hypothetical protein